MRARRVVHGQPAVGRRGAGPPLHDGVDDDPPARSRGPRRLRTGLPPRRRRAAAAPCAKVPRALPGAAHAAAGREHLRLLLARAAGAPSAAQLPLPSAVVLIVLFCYIDSLPATAQMYAARPHDRMLAFMQSSGCLLGLRGLWVLKMSSELTAVSTFRALQ